MSTSIPCRAKDPMTCPYHGNLLKAEEASARADAARRSGDFDAYLNGMQEAAKYSQLAVANARETPEVAEFLDSIHRNPIKVPTVGSPYEVSNYLPATTQLVPKVVQTQTQLRQAVSNTAGIRGKDNVRHVVASMNPKQVFRDRNAPETVVEGPQDGRAIVVDLHHAATDLRVDSGNALINATSRYGGSVKVNGSAQVTVITPPGKIHIDANDESRVIIVPRDGARGLVYAAKNAHVEIREIDGVHHTLQLHRRDS